MRNPKPAFVSSIIVQKRELRVRHYRWEFLRRNSSYQKDVEDFEQQFRLVFPDGTAFWYSQIIGNQLPDDLELRLFGLRVKWDISAIFPPEWTFDGDTGKYEYRLRSFVTVPGRFMLRRTGCVAVIRDSEHFGRLSNFDDVADWVAELYLNLQINAACPLKATLDVIEKEVRRARARFKQKYRKNMPRWESINRRSRLENYRDYLRVWDLRKEGLTFQKIAEKLYPKIDAAERVRGHYRRALQLINGDYREIE